MTRSNLGKELDRFAAEVSEEGNKQDPPKSTYDVYARVSPHLDKPTHLDPYIRTLDKAILEGGVDWTFSAPPQHGKTFATEHAFIFSGIIQAMRRANGDRAEAPSHAYSTFADDRARQILNETQALAFEAGLNPQTRDGELRFEGGTRIKFTGTNAGTLTGWPIRARSLHVVDDPIGARKDALSPVKRQSLRDWFQGVAFTRRHPGASCVVMMARWTTDDLIGWLVQEKGWPFIRLAAICDDVGDPNGREIGEPLWDKRPLSWYAEQGHQKDAITWASLWQGRPRNEGDALFEPALYYDALPLDAGPFQTAYGCDLAYTEKTRADYSVLLRGRWYLWSQALYLTGCWRKQWQADKFSALMRTQVVLEPGPVLWHGAQAEKGTAQLIQTQIPSFRFVSAQGRGDPYARAIPVAEQLWNEPHRKVFVPRVAAWSKAFTDELEEFTGMGGQHDDQVMSLASLAENFLRGARGGNDRDLRRNMATRYGSGLRGRDRSDD
jgi:phage terminase large subunit-like protein